MVSTASWVNIPPDELSSLTAWLLFVAAYVAKPSGKTWTLTFADQTELEDWLAFTQTKSAITTSVTPDVDDQFLSLATCSYEFDDARFVVVAVRR